MWSSRDTIIHVGLGTKLKLLAACRLTPVAIKSRLDAAEKPWPLCSAQGTRRCVGDAPDKQTKPKKKKQKK